MQQITLISLFILFQLLIGKSFADEKKISGSKPNILWITGEDMSARWLGCYGNKQIETPNFDKFASEGFLYSNCFTQSPVCAPARSGWITGIHPTSLGTVYMRSKNPIPERLKLYPDQLRANGYFVANWTKTDYNFSNRREKGHNGGGENQGTCGHYLKTWDHYGKFAWENPDRELNQPFFQVVNTAGCHESFLHRSSNTNTHPKSKITVNPEEMKLAAYHPDIPEMRMDYARYTVGVMKADNSLGAILDKLKQDGLSENTIVVYASDHGGVIGRSKRFLFDSGTHSALIIRIPEKFKYLWPDQNVGVVVDRLVSFIDMPKTWLSITGSAVPKEMQGNIFLGKDEEEPRQFVHMGRQRMDEVPDMQRGIRDGRYLYIRNFEPFRPNGQHLAYLWKAPSMNAWEKHHLAGKTDAITGAFFKPKPVEQLFDCLQDPDNVANLAGNPDYADRLKQMRTSLKDRQVAIHDCGYLPEDMLLARSKKHQMPIYDLIRTPDFFDQVKYMEAADLANFASIEDASALFDLLESEDEALRNWGTVGFLHLDKEAATPAVLAKMTGFLKTEVENFSTLDIRVTAALYLGLLGKEKNEVIHCLAEAIVVAESLRAWGNVFLLGKQIEGIAEVLSNMKLKSKDKERLAVFQSRLKNKI